MMSKTYLYHRLALLACVGWLFTACITTPTATDRAVGVDSAAPITETVSAGGDMQLEGVIVEIMESYPLQLVVETTTGRYQVALTEATTLTEAADSRAQADLQVQMRIRLTGVQHDANAMTATTIEIIAKP